MFDNGGFSTPNNVDTPSDGKKKTERREQKIFPVCVRQIRDSSEPFALFGQKAQLVTLVCLLRDYDVASTKATYTVEDHTGSIQAILWLDSDGNNEVNLPPVKEGRYVRIYGSIRVTDEIKHLLIIKMVPIENINELTTHLLEVIHVRLAVENLNSEKKMNKIVQNNPSAELATSMLAQEDPAASGDSCFTSLQEKVYEAFKICDSATGRTRASVLELFPTYQRAEANASINYLQQEGHIYSTLDDNTFRAT